MRRKHGFLYNFDFRETYFKFLIKIIEFDIFKYLTNRCL